MRLNVVSVHGFCLLVPRWSIRLVVSFCCAAGLGGLFLSSICCSQRLQAVFFTTVSPDNTYEVRLKGEKGRWLLLTNEVRADVFKAGHPLISDVWLHSTADSFDVSFDAEYPDARWLAENVVEFYRKEYYENGHDSLIVTNRAAKSIQWLRIQSFNKFLVLEMPAGDSTQVELPAPRGDSQWIGAEGAFTEGEKIQFKARTFDRRGSQRNHFVYKLAITDSGFTIEH